MQTIQLVLRRGVGMRKVTELFQKGRDFPTVSENRCDVHKTTRVPD